MKKITGLFSVLLVVVVVSASYAQQGKPHHLGKSSELRDQIKSKVNFLQKQPGKPELSLKIAARKAFTAQVNYHKAEGKNEYVIGQIKNAPHSEFFIRVDTANLEGAIILRDSKKAYKYYSDKEGNAYVEEVDINDVICIEYHDLGLSSGPGNIGEFSETVLAVPDLQSLPGANGCVLLDYDGHYVSGTRWNSGNPIDAKASGMSEAAILESFDLVSEDFRPFNINITTSEAVFNSYPKNRRMRCIITPTNTAAPGAGGVAYLNSFSWNDDTPCWVFITSSAKPSAEAVSHEIGHTLSLAHDGRTSPSEGYFAGHGDWAPIMGVGYYKPVTQWSKGEYAYANNREDDLAKITSTTHGVGYRADDHGNSTSMATGLVIDAAGKVVASSNKGIIERNTDVDMFKFTTTGGSVNLTFTPAPRHADLDIVVKLYNQAGGLISTHNPSGLASGISTNLSAGTYYFSVDGIGAGSASTTGYSDYASLGSYFISGSIPVTAVNQAPVVSLSSPANGSSFTAPARITITANASDADGTVSKVEFYNGTVKLGEDMSAPYSYSWTNVAAGTYTLTARAIDNSGSLAGSSAVSIEVKAPNQAPVVSLSSPSNGSSFTAPANITISANASDADGTVSKVEFYNGTVKLGEDLTAPYSYSWTNVAAGTYTLTARATDNSGALAGSSAVSIAVSSPDITYCSSKANNSRYEYIDYVALGTIDNASGNNGGYGDFTGFTSSINAGASYSIYFRPSFAGSIYYENWAIWIDFNRDGDFTDQGELIVSGRSSGSNTYHVNFTVPATASVGKTRMRVAMKYGGTPGACETFSYGEVEDYSLDIAGTPVAAVQPEYTQTAELLGNDSGKDISISLHPNPASDRLTINHIRVEEEVEGKIVDISGEEVLKFAVSGPAVNLDISNLPAGIYVVYINSGVTEYTERFVKQ